MVSRLRYSNAQDPCWTSQLVELKNGTTYNGHLVEVDNFMNITLKDVYQTSTDGERFWKMKEMFIKGMVVSRYGSPSMHESTVVVLCPTCPTVSLFRATSMQSRALIRSQIKYFRIADAILDLASEEQERQRQFAKQRGSGRGARGGPGGRGGA